MKRVVLVLPFAALAGWLVFRNPGSGHDAPAPKAGAEGETAKTDEPKSTKTHPAECRFEPEATLTYVLTASVEARMGINGGATGAPNVKRDARSTLDLRVLRVDEHGAVLAARYRDADASLGNITQPFLMRIAPDCEISGFARLAASSLVSARAAQAMTSNLVFALGPDKADGANDYGAFRAAYTHAGNRIERRIEAYTRVWSEEWTENAFEAAADGASKNAAAANAKKDQKPKESYLAVELGEGPWFATLSGNERVMLLNTELASRIEAKRVPPPYAALIDVSTDESKYVWEDLLHRRIKAPPPPKEPQTEAEKKEIAAMAALAPSTALASYRDGLSSGQDFSTSWRKLSRYMEVRPEAPGEVAKQVRAGQLPEEGSAGVFMALGQAQVSEARDALMSIKNDTNVGPFDRARSVFSLVGRNDVGVELAQSLRSDAQAITGESRPIRLYARHAALALGMFGSLRSDDEGIVGEANGVVKDILAMGRNDVTLRPAFGTVANLGDARLLSTVTPYMKSPDPKIRRAAAISIRRMPPAATRELTSDLLRSETDAEVRRDLYHTVRLQHFDARVTPDRNIVLAAIDDLLHNRPQGLTRQSIVHLLGAAQKEYPEAHAALIAAVPLENEVRDEGIFELLQHYLGGEEFAAALGAAK